VDDFDRDFQLLNPDRKDDKKQIFLKSQNSFEKFRFKRIMDL